MQKETRIQKVYSWWRVSASTVPTLATAQSTRSIRGERCRATRIPLPDQVNNQRQVVVQVCRAARDADTIDRKSRRPGIEMVLHRR